MSCWRVLRLSDFAYDQHPLQLLIKAQFGRETYGVFLTDLSSIWSEELDVAGIIARASQQESPIEVSLQDTSQLPILLDNVRKSLSAAEDTACRLTRNGEDGIVIHTSTILPQPLDSLRWRFVLRKESSVMLKNELILPLLVSSLIQHDRINSLCNIVSEKDKAITKLLDQFESSNLDLATAFPSIGGSKPGRRPIKREQAAKHIPALLPFNDSTWKQETSHVQGLRLCTLGLFQEALSECYLGVPAQMRSKECEDRWWTSIKNESNESDLLSRPRGSQPIFQTKPPTPPEPSGDETEDGFETHEHFNVRSPSPHKKQQPDVCQSKSTEDGGMDALPENQAQKPPRVAGDQGSRISDPPDWRPSPLPKAGLRTAKKAKGFRIGGAKAERGVELSPSSPPVGKTGLEEAKARSDQGVRDTAILAHSKSRSSEMPKIVKKPFKIGGKYKVEKDGGPASIATLPPRIMTENPNVDNAPLAAVNSQGNGRAEEIQEQEQNAEERADRRRRELKRKIEEMARKQTQKKKRF
ncbi:XLF-domain-containing protein [Lojkania enalia]|uniref:Non-homologous end-joining factor 1 n=1 Tax=Lojkania enalia TaxID=147567 RepID=A0A9P4K9K1_9PLEO|nr:XLF-domain-containing protein [Didymosphaeria enalia]